MAFEEYIYGNPEGVPSNPTDGTMGFIVPYEGGYIAGSDDGTIMQTPSESPVDALDALITAKQNADSDEPVETHWDQSDTPEESPNGGRVYYIFADEYPEDHENPYEDPDFPA